MTSKVQGVLSNSNQSVVEKLPSFVKLVSPLNQHISWGCCFFHYTQSSAPGEFLGFKCQECSQIGHLKGLMYSLVTLMQLGQPKVVVEVFCSELLISKHCMMYATSCLICLCRSCGATWCHCWECGWCYSSPTVCWRHHICIPLLQKKEAHCCCQKDTVWLLT